MNFISHSVQSASPALVTFRRKDESSHCSRPNFYATSDGVFEVALAKVTREDEGAYEVTLEAANGQSSTISYVLVVMGEYGTNHKANLFQSQDSVPKLNVNPLKSYVFQH